MEVVQRQESSSEQVSFLEKSFFREMRILIAKPGEDDHDTTGHDRHWRPTVSQIFSATNGHFRPLSIEESETHHKWRRAVLVFYGLIAISAVLLSVAIGPPSQTAVKNNPAYSAIASRGAK